VVNKSNSSNPYPVNSYTLFVLTQFLNFEKDHSLISRFLSTLSFENVPAHCFFPSDKAGVASVSSMLCGTVLLLSLLATCVYADFFAYSSTLKMEATCSSETSVDFHRISWRYIPEDRTLILLHITPANHLGLDNINSEPKGQERM
jgi:hypothetical protein